MGVCAKWKVLYVMRCKFAVCGCSRAGGLPVGLPVGRCERSRSKEQRAPAMFAQGGVDERQQLFARGREALNERRRHGSVGVAADEEDYNEPNDEDCVCPVGVQFRAAASQPNEK